MSHWAKTAKLGTLCQRVGGGTPNRDMPEYWGGDIPWFTVADFSDSQSLQRAHTSRECITELGLRQSAGKLVQVGSVICSTRVVVGKVAIAERPLVTNQDFASLICANTLDNEFLAYFLINSRDRLRARQSGATIQGIRLEVLENLDIPLPSVPEQRRIVARIQECFSRLDEMEQLQEELDDDLELITDASVRQLADELRNDHPSLTIGQIVAQDGGAMRSGPFGSAMKHDEFVPEGHLVIGIANVQENRFDPVRKWMINDAKFEVMRRYSVEPGDVLITIMGTIGRTCVVPDDIGSAITSKHVYRIRFPKKRVNPHYISYLINFDSKTREQLFGTAAGGVMPGLNATKLRDLSIPLPPLKVQDRMVEQLDRTHTALQETRSLHSADDLTNLRTAILREAFAGRL